MALTVYTTSWCGPCRRLKTQLTREGISFREIDVEQDPEAAAFVMSVNNGNRTVPTVVFPDGTAVTNPSVLEVKARLNGTAVTG
ncbi:mycoredoxin [Thermopolyspora sp. NPDC052614]|uniref:mycoredoxin n=1 Tax=Thermopolyspora sp. NPDC052614 TaxID=3155682 RepID=UPI00341F4149